MSALSSSVQPLSKRPMFAFGFQTNLTVALDVSGTETQAQNATTALSSLTFGVPDNLWDAATGALKPMDKSWYACRHTYISVEAMPREGLYAGEGCGFLPDDCIKDLQSSMAKNWGQAADDTTSYMCSGYTMDYIPKSCRGVVGLIREDVTGFDANVPTDIRQQKALFSKGQNQYTWRMGTGYLHPYDSRAPIAAANRTYIIGTVYGYSQGTLPSANKPLSASLQCLSP